MRLTVNIGEKHDQMMPAVCDQLAKRHPGLLISFDGQNKGQFVLHLEEEIPTDHQRQIIEQTKKEFYELLTAAEAK